MRHPAKYNDKLFGVFREMLEPVRGGRVLDIFAGTGKIHQLSPDWQTYGVEIEKEWADMHPHTFHRDATNLQDFSCDDNFDAICTSPTYGNRMADKYAGKNGDGAKRNTYTCALGKPLHDNNSGGMQWGIEYRNLHEAAYFEAARVLKPGGLFVLNMKNHIRKGKEIKVTEWHTEHLLGSGFDVVKLEEIPLTGNGFGANGKSRVPFEYVILFKKK